MDRTKFFEHLRSKSSDLFGASLSQRQVDGIIALLDEGAALPAPHMAHVLAEVHHETGGGMYPVKETVLPSHKNKNPTDELVKKRLEKAWSSGQMPWVKSPYWRSGFFGRGQIQCTHETNYDLFSSITGKDLVANPNLALDLKTSAKIAVIGCQLGLFTGKKLANYDTPDGFDHYNARRIVNGMVAKQAAHVQALGRKYTAALTLAGWKPRILRAAHKPVERAAVSRAPATPTNPFMALLTALLRALGLKKD